MFLCCCAVDYRRSSFLYVLNIFDGFTDELSVAVVTLDL